MSKSEALRPKALAKRRIGPATRPDRWAQHDGRTAEAKLLQTVRKQLAEHVGGRPSVAERLLIDRASWLVLHTSRMDARALETGGFSPHASREYLAWVNALRRALHELGIKGSGATNGSASLSDLLATPSE